MNEEELKIWVRGQLTLGQSKEQIQESLRNAGWDDAAIRELLKDGVPEFNKKPSEIPLQSANQRPVAKGTSKKTEKDAPMLKNAFEVAVVFSLLFAIVWFTSFYVGSTYLGMLLGIGLLLACAFYLGFAFRTKKRLFFSVAIYSATSMTAVFILLLLYFYFLGFLQVYLAQNHTTQRFLANLSLDFVLVFWPILVINIIAALAGKWVSKKFNLPYFILLRPVVLFFAVWLAILFVFSSSGSEEGVEFGHGACSQFSTYGKSSLLALVEFHCSAFNMDRFINFNDPANNFWYSSETYFKIGIPPRNKFIRWKYEISTLARLFDYLPQSADFYVTSLFSEFGLNKPEYFSNQYSYFYSFKKATEEKNAKDALLYCLDATRGYYDTLGQAFDYIYSNVSDADSKFGPKKAFETFIEEKKKGTLSIREKVAKLGITYDHGFPINAQSLKYDENSFYSSVQNFDNSKDALLSFAMDNCKSFLSEFSFDISLNRAYKDGNRIYLEINNLVSSKNTKVRGIFVNGAEYKNTHCDVELTPKETFSCDFELQNKTLALLDKLPKKEVLVIVKADLKEISVALNETNNFTYRR